MADVTISEPFDALRIREVIEEESANDAVAGWRSCTGCHETNEGAETGHYPYSKAFGCYVGAGCRECGGIGVRWEHYSKEDLCAMARDLPASAGEPVAQLGGAPDDLRNLINVVFADMSLEQIQATCKQVIDARDPALIHPSPVSWAVERWRTEVANRPLQNVHRRSLDDAWRQVIRHFDGDDQALCGPRHDDLVAANPEIFRATADAGEPAIKALEWVDEGDGVWVADTTVGYYRVSCPGGDLWVLAIDGDRQPHPFELARFAREAAQSDFETRIRSALVHPTPVSSPVRVVDGAPSVRGQYADLIQALSRLAGNRQSDGVSSLVSGDDRAAIINGCHDLMIATRGAKGDEHHG